LKKRKGCFESLHGQYTAKQLGKEREGGVEAGMTQSSKEDPVIGRVRAWRERWSGRGGLRSRRRRRGTWKRDIYGKKARKGAYSGEKGKAS